MLLSFAALTCNGATEPSQGGQVIWQVAGTGWSITPSHDSSRVFFGTMDHRVIALDRETGKQLWEASTGVGPGGATAGTNTLVVGDVVVIGDVDIYAFDRETGERRWVFQANDLDETGRDRLSADSATIFASSLYGRVYAIDAKSGTQRWMAQIPGGTERTSTFDPTVSNGAVYVGTWHETHPLTGGLAALDAATGEILWIHDFTPRSPELDSYCRSHPVVTESLVIASAADGIVYGLDRATGETHWIAPAVDGYIYNDWRWLEIAGSTVIATSMSGSAMGYDAETGALRWSTYIHGGALLGDIATDGRLVVIALGEVVTLDVDTGTILWRTGEGKQGGGYWGQPAIDGPRVYASRQDGFVALRAR
jgi:outer membrane protein assembly factor BamB